ncbi:MAG: polysaccharide biosynthesis/export family protein [Flavobacterium sp.]|nr:polysaccharide biosynthesis/export family protein [Flavobacterium sp.]
MKLPFLLLLFLILLSSCGSRKDIVFYQNSESAKEISSNFESRFKCDDMLRIFINTKDTEASLAFNLPVVSTILAKGGIGQLDYQSYLINNLGFIEYPILGKIKVAGLTKLELINYLKQQFKPYLKSDPIININILNYRISVTGEVAKPGSFNVNSERISLPEALALAGDLTIFGKRSNIIVLRDINGVKTINRIDITKTDFINSEFYYLTQNDVVYVEPNKTRVNASAIGPNASIIISGLSLLITVVALLIR